LVKTLLVGDTDRPHGNHIRLTSLFKESRLKPASYEILQRALDMDRLFGRMYAMENGPKLGNLECQSLCRLGSVKTISR
jgi:hypothetical protein